MDEDGNQDPSQQWGSLAEWAFGCILVLVTVLAAPALATVLPAFAVLIIFMLAFLVFVSAVTIVKWRTARNGHPSRSTGAPVPWVAWTVAALIWGGVILLEIWYSQGRNDQSVLTGAMSLVGLATAIVVIAQVKATLRKSRKADQIGK